MHEVTQPPNLADAEVDIRSLTSADADLKIFHKNKRLIAAQQHLPTHKTLFFPDKALTGAKEIGFSIF